MSAKTSVDDRRGTWISGLILAAGVVLIVLALKNWTGAGSHIVFLSVGGIAVLWGLWDRGLSWLMSFPATTLAIFIGGGNPQARRYGARLTREAMVYTLFMVVTLLGALLGHSNMLLFVFALMAGAFVLNGQATLTVIRQLRAKRSIPDLVFAGQPCPIRIELANRKRFFTSWMIIVEDLIQLDAEQLQPAILFQRVPARGVREATYQITPGTRGIMRFRPLRIASRYPLGLWERGFELAVEEQVLVLPRIGKLTPLFRDSLNARQRSQYDAPARAGVFDEEFHRLREFRVGDSRRAIHWRTSARRNELMVREYQEQHDPELLIVLELWAPEFPTPNDLQRVELLISFAATCAVSRAKGTMDTGVQLIVCGQTPLILGEAGSGVPLRGLLESLALVGPSLEPKWNQVAEALNRRQGDATRKIFATTHPAGIQRLSEQLTAWEAHHVAEEFEHIGGSDRPIADLLVFSPTQEETR